MMRNKILTLFRNNVPYIKELRQLSGSVTASILMQQLDYWFEKKPGGFYKFLEPCENNELYKTGDSWTEELGFSKYEFKTAFEKIGVAYKSKNEFKKAMEKGDPFQGKFYCCYVDKMKYITVYYRNHELLDFELNKLVSSVDEDSSFTVYEESLFTYINNVDLRESESKDLETLDQSPITVNEESSYPYMNNVHLDITETTTERETTDREKDDYRKKSQNTNYQVKEIEQIWREKALKDFEYTPVEAVNEAIKEFGIGKIVQAIDRISKSEFMKERTTINKFFNMGKDFQQIRYTLDGEYDNLKKESKVAESNIDMKYFQ